MSGADPEAEAAHARVRAAYARREKTATPPDPSLAYILSERKAATQRMIAEAGWLPLAQHRILDVGCGRGYWIRELAGWGAEPTRLTGLDLLAERLVDGAGLGPEGVRWCQGSAAAMPFRDQSFDLVMQSTVFSSILEPGLRRQVAAEIGRVLTPAGSVLWYDFTYDNPRNPDVCGIPRTEIARLFPGWDLHLQRITLAPPIARRIPSALLPTAYPLLNALPLLRTHYLGILRKPA